MDALDSGINAYERAGAIGLALLALAAFVVPAFGVLVWVVRTNRTDRAASSKDRREEIERTERRFDRLIDAHIDSMHKLSENLGEMLSAKLSDINSNINAVHTRFDNHIGGRETEQGKASNG